jgi:YD repeat-containing protein
MQSVKFIIVKFLFAAALLLGTLRANATDDPEITRIFSGVPSTPSQPIVPLAIGSIDELIDDVFYNNPASIENPNNDKITNVISLKVREEDLNKIRSNFSVTVKFNVEYTLVNGNTGVASNVSLIINYDKAAGLKYNARQTYKFDQCRKVKITIVDIVPAATYNWPYLEVLNLENRMLRRRDYIFAANDILPLNPLSLPLAAGADEVPVSWSNASNTTAVGKTHIDVEWTWVDEEAMSQFMAPNPANGNNLALNADLLFKNNASRITVESKKFDFYSIPLIYDGKGRLFYRIRPLQLKENEQVINGIWSASGFNGITYYEITTDDKEHERSLNWQTTTSFAEEGKRKTVVQYFDGTLRGRQTVTKDNISNQTVVAESFYDFQGRPTINILPAPTINAVIKFTSDFNKFVGGYVTPKEAFDLMPTNVNACNYETPRLDKNNPNGGAAQYYSDQNPEKQIGFNKFIPDADGYAYTETRYTPDATGRIEAQGGVGGTFQLGKGSNGHETRYTYGKPFQEDLDALFGTEVGDASHYSKNSVRDANGQYSVSYVDMHGRTIATALAGKSPENVKPLTSSTLSQATLTKSLITATNNYVEGRSVVSTSSFEVTQAVPYQFHYELDPLSAEILACNPPLPPGAPQQTVCYDCYYDLEIRITGPCGFTSVKTANNLHFVNNAPVYDVTCNNNLPAPIIVDFTENLAEGEYTVTKKLTVNKQAQDWYRENIYKNRNICKTFDNFYQEILAQMSAESSECTICSECDSAANTSTKMPSVVPNLNRLGIPFILGKKAINKKTYPLQKTIQKAAGRVASRNGGTTTSNAVPDNDLCENATLLTVNQNYDCFYTTPGTNIDATESLPIVSCFNGSFVNVRDVWYKFIATAPTHRVSVEINSNNRVASRNANCGRFLTVYSGTCPDPNDPNAPNLTEIFCTSDEPLVNDFTNLNVGETYYVRVTTYGICNITFDVCVGGPAPPVCPAPLDTCFSVCDQPKNYMEALRDAMLDDMTPEEGQYARLNTDLDEDGIFGGYLADFGRHEAAELQPYNIFSTSNSAFLKYKRPVDENGAPLSSFLDENGQPDATGTVALVNAMSSAEFNANFKPSWAKQLLPYHPEYCKLRVLETDPTMMDSYKRDAIMEDIDTWAAALQAGYIDEIDGNVIVNNDPFFNCGNRAIPYKQNMLQYIGTNFDLYPVPNYPPPGQTAVPLSFWKIAYLSVFCAENSMPPPSTDCAVNAPLTPGGFDLSSICEADKNKLWVIFRSLYLSEKDKMINDWLSTQCPSSPSNMYDILKLEKFERRFGKPADYYTNENYLTQLVAGATNGANDDQAAGFAFIEYGENCESYKERWAQKLRECPTIKALDVTTIVAGEEVVSNIFIDGGLSGSTQIPSLLDRLKNICHYSSDETHPYGASSLPNGPIPNLPPNTPASFQAAIIAQWSAVFPSSTQMDFICNEDLIDFPQPYYQQSPLSLLTIDEQKDECVCERLNQLDLAKNSYNSANNTSLTLSQYILIKHGTEIRQTLLVDTLMHGCNLTPLTTCNSYDPPLELPAILDCDSPIENCVDCDKFTTLVNQFKAKYPGSIATGVFYTNNPTDQELAANKALAQYINNRTGFSRTWGEYLSFKDSCIDAASCTTNCAPKPLICMEIMFPDVEIEDSCGKFIQTLAYNEAVEQYNEYLQQQNDYFDNFYLNKCLEAKNIEKFTFKAILSPTDPPSEYHYTLYYYDQAGNLVKTVPPEGVRANFTLAHSNNVKALRELGEDLFMPHVLATQYRYNSLNQVVEQKTPDAGISKFWYDELGRLALSQNAKQATAIAGKSRYSYTNYDALGRITEVGEKLKTGAAQPSSQIQEIAQGLGAISLANWLAASTSEPRKQITKTVYDLPYTPLAPILAQQNMRNRVSHTWVQAQDDGSTPPNSGNPLNDAPWETATFYTYDIHGNVDVLLQDYKKTMGLVPGNRFKRVTYKYDLISGKVNEVAYQPGSIDAFYHRYNYDAENKITSVQTSKEYVYWEIEARYDYYRHGPLARTKLGQLEVQGVDYAYTLQGWLKGVNTTALKRPGTIGAGQDCGDYSAVENLYIYNRPSYSPNYIAKTSINFMPSAFTSLDPDNFVAYIDPNIPSCGTNGNAGDEVYDYTNDGKFDMGQDGKTAASGLFEPNNNTVIYNPNNPYTTRAYTYGSNTNVVDAYGFSLNYFNGDYNRIDATATNPFATINMRIPTLNASNPYSAEQLFNGNIGAMVVSIPKIGSTNVYGYNYDQLNRIVNMDVFAGINQNTNQFTAFAMPDYREAVTYDANGNIKTYLRNGHNNPSQYGPASLGMDNLTYQYEKDANGNIVSNKLRYVHDQVLATAYGEDIDSQTPLSLAAVQAQNALLQPTDNYAYDEIGNLIKDEKEGITNIDWTVYGKIAEITKVKDGITTIITYTYDAAGNRISKTVAKGSDAAVKTFYVRDASGNVMSVYDNQSVTSDIAGYLAQKEIHLYGSSRLGVLNTITRVDVDSRVKPYMDGVTNNEAEIVTFVRGQKFYELTNHLGNVLVTISDKKLTHFVYCDPSTDRNCLQMPDGGYPVVFTYYKADVITANDYYPFGMQLPERKYSTPNSNYRYGFNGQEKSDDVTVGNYTAMYWEYDSRIGRRWNEDPVLKEFESPYLCFSGNPIWFSDINGDDPNPPGYDWGYAKRYQDFHIAAIRVAYNTLVERQTAKDFNWNKNNEYRKRVNTLATASSSAVAKSTGFTKEQFTSEVNKYYKVLENAFNWSANETVTALSKDLSKYNSYSGSDIKSQHWAIRENYYIIDGILDKPEAIAYKQETIFEKCATFAQTWTSGVGSGVSFSNYYSSILSKTRVQNRTLPRMPATKTSTKLITQFSSRTIDDAVGLVMKDPNKIAHLFAGKHNLGGVVTKLGGQENTVRAVLNAANGKLPSNGVFNNIPVNVGGQNILIRGSVVNGVPRLGTMFIP